MLGNEPRENAIVAAYGLLDVSTVAHDCLALFFPGAHDRCVDIAVDTYGNERETKKTWAVKFTALESKYFRQARTSITNYVLRGEVERKQERTEGKT